MSDHVSNSVKDLETDGGDTSVVNNKVSISVENNDEDNVTEPMLKHGTLQYDLGDMEIVEVVNVF